MKKLNINLLLLTLTLSGCAGIPQIPSLAIPTAAVLATAIPNGPTKTPAPAVTAVTATEVVTAPTAAPAMIVLPEIDPEKTVTLFLEGTKANADFALTSKLFSASYAAQVKDDAGLTDIFGKEAMINEYRVGFPAYSADSMIASLEATVYLPQPSNVRFSLTLENNEWRIDSISILTKTGEYPTAPEGVVLSFLTSYQEAPDRMSSFLSTARRAQQPPGGATAMLQISGSLEGMVIQSAAVNPDPPTASIVVVIRAGGTDYPRKFVLTRDATLWGIESIESMGS